MWGSSSSSSSWRCSWRSWEQMCRARCGERLCRSRYRSWRATGSGARQGAASLVAAHSCRPVPVANLEQLKTNAGWKAAEQSKRHDQQQHWAAQSLKACTRTGVAHDVQHVSSWPYATTQHEVALAAHLTTFSPQESESKSLQGWSRWGVGRRGPGLAPTISIDGRVCAAECVPTADSLCREPTAAKISC